MSSSNRSKAAVSSDAYLARWSSVLYVMIALTMLYYLVSAVRFLAGAVGRITLVNAQEVWSIATGELPLFERGVLFCIVGLADIVLLYGFLQLYRLARNFRRGQIFEEYNARLLIRTGCALVAMGLLNAVSFTLARHYLYWRGISPWLGDASITYGIKHNYVMVGLFLFILGQVMRRAVELEESNRSII